MPAGLEPTPAIEGPSVARFADVPCAVTVILGTARVTIGACLALAPRTVVRLDQSAGDDVRIAVNGVTIARGEVVVVDEGTAVRLTEIAPAAAREEQA